MQSKNTTTTSPALMVFIVALFFSPFYGKSQIFAPDGLRMPGDWNNWTNETGMGGDFDLSRITSGTLRWKTSFQYAGESGAQSFKFVSTSFGDPWGNEWAGNTNVALNTAETFMYGTPSNPENQITLSQGNWYTVVFEDNGYTNSRAVFLETSQQPVLITSVTQEPLLVGNQEDATITANLSAMPGEEEFFLLRYTTNQWESSHTVPLTVQETTLTGIIPGFPSETTVEYYVLSTTHENITQDFDLFTLNMNNNSGSNFQYVVNQTIDCGQQIDVVTSDPAFPLESTPLTIFFNAEMGNGGLFNHDGDVYAHTGVITNLSLNNTDWKYVKTAWGENTPETKLTRLGDNLYSLDIPNIRAYYDVPANEDILQMAFVFRSDLPDENGNYREHKNVDNSDIFFTVYELDLRIKILSPGKRNPLVSPNQVLPICVEALENESISVYLNNEILATEQTTSLTWPLALQTLEPGTHWIKARATSGENHVWDSVSIYLRGPVLIQELPQGVANGINYIDDNTVTLVLHDPPGLKQFAFAIGDFSNWMPNDDNYMRRTPDGQRFWVTIESLEANTEYGFQYYLDGNMRLPDAYAEKILDPWNDRWIPETTYPNLKEYPFEKTTGIVSIMHPGRPAYQWEVPDFTPVAINETQQDLVIYELLIRDFLETRHITDVIDKLDYLQDLGVNAIQLLPIMEFDGNESWGYAPNFFFATDKYYGTREAYKQFIDECHKRGLAVILDVVPNHAFGQSPMVNMYFDPMAGEFGQPLPENPWFNQQAPHPYSVGYDFNHEKPEVREFFKRVFEYWLTEFNVDGYRIDLSKGLTQTFSGQDMGQWSAYDQSRIDILNDYYNHIKSVNPNAYVILEHFAHNDEETVLANNGMLLWGAVHERYQQIAMGYQQNSDISWSYHGNRGWSFPNIVDYMENHDEERLMFEAITFGNSSNDYNLSDTLTALKHMEMAAVIWLAIPGPKMIWQFGELGYDYSIFFGGDRTAPKPPRWDYWDIYERQRIHRVYNAMIQLRSSDAFRFGQFSHDFSGEGKRAWISHSSMNVVAAVNTGVTGFDMAPGFQHGGTWYNYFTGESFEVSDPGGHFFFFGPGEYKVFTNEPMPRPFYNLTVLVKSKQTTLPVHGASVNIERAGTRTTNPDGEAPFTLLDGSFDITVEREGFEPYTGNIVINSDFNLEILLDEDNVVHVYDPIYSSLLQVFPNPATQSFTIQTPEKAIIEIYDTKGRLMLAYTATGKDEKIDTAGWQPGIYLVQSITSRGMQTQKVILH